MCELSITDSLEDRVTFGAGFIPFIGLLVLVFFAFVFGLIRFQNVRAPYGPLSPYLYLGFTVLGLLVAYALLRQIGKWTFSPSLHRRQSAIIAVGGYFSITLIAVFIGYLIINPRISAVKRIGISDVIVGVTVASVYTAILSATSLFQDPAELFGKPSRRSRQMQEWHEAFEEARAANGANGEQVQAHARLIDESEALLDELEDAKTNGGERLRQSFDEWLTDFRNRSSSVSRQAILTGETENQRLVEKHQKLTWVRQQVADIDNTRGDESWNDTNH